MTTISEDKGTFEKTDLEESKKEDKEELGEEKEEKSQGLISKLVDKVVDIGGAIKDVIVGSSADKDEIKDAAADKLDAAKEKLGDAKESVSDFMKNIKTKIDFNYSA